MSEYKLERDGGVFSYARNASIPAAPTNTDYAAYLEWQAAGGVPDPVDPPTTAEVNAPVLAQISALDVFIPRGLEDLIAASGFDVTKLPQIQQDRLAQKAALRAKLVR